MILFLKHPENYDLVGSSIIKVRNTYCTCDDCPDCMYYISNRLSKIKVQKCKNHQPISNKKPTN